MQALCLHHTITCMCQTNMGKCDERIPFIPCCVVNQPKNITTISMYYADNHLIGTPRGSILDGNKDNINIHFLGPQVPGWAACKCPLHCLGPSLLKAASRLSPHYPGRYGGG
jgi:hypothetical protein